MAKDDQHEIIDQPPAGRFRELPRWYHFLGDWWQEATGRTSEWHHDLSPGRAILRRIMLWSPLVVLVVLVGGGIGAVLFTGWRAQDLARKAVESVERGDLRLALIQSESARNLRGNHPAVLRAQARVRFEANDPSCLQTWEQIARQGPLSLEDRQAQAEAAVRFGGAEAFGTAIAEFEATGRLADAETWRGRRALSQKNFTAAERHLRQAVEEEPAAERRIELARLLVMINTPESLAEAVQIVESMMGGPDEKAALAFGLQAVPAGPATRRAWAERVMVDPKADDPAVLTAADVLVNDRLAAVDEIVERLQVVFTGANVEDRGRYAKWLLDRNRPVDALVFARAGEARGSRGTFLVRAEALSSTGNWRELLELVDAGSPVSEPVTMLLRARAEQGLGRTAAAERSWARAVRTAPVRGQLPEVMAQVDEAGRPDVSDRVLLELCGEHATSEYALRVARWRFSLRGAPRLRQEAFRRALQVAPQAASVQDLARLERLLDRQPVDTAETAAALESEPGNVDFRLTHALALLVDGRAAEARKVLEPSEIVRHQLQPGQKAVVAAVLGATGSRTEAIALARTMRPTHLTDAEYRLVYEFTLADAPTIAAPGVEME
jgi:tetratricopeptide (TPR) repeat protein